MKFFASCALLLLLYSSARGQQITVLDKTDLQPIPFASITTTDRSKGVKTNTIGKADISSCSIRQRLPHNNAIIFRS
jgi:hypothetical protein